MDGLRNGKAHPGLVLDDTEVFQAAADHDLEIATFEILLPESEYRAFSDGWRVSESKASTPTDFPTGMAIVIVLPGWNAWLSLCSREAWPNLPTCKDSAGI